MPNVSSKAAPASLASDATCTACIPAAVAAAPTTAKPVAAADPTLVIPLANLPKAVSDLRIAFNKLASSPRNTYRNFLSAIMLPLEVLLVLLCHH